eukprot:5373791-Amphidinium_carterae.1
MSLETAFQPWYRNSRLLHANHASALWCHTGSNLGKPKFGATSSAKRARAILGEEEGLLQLQPLCTKSHPKRFEAQSIFALLQEPHAMEEIARSTMKQ